MSASLATIAPRLRQLILMLSSNQAGEVVAAAAAIERTLQANGHDWHELADRVLSDARQPKRARPNDGKTGDWRAMCEVCLRHAHLLRSREQEFVSDLGDWRGRPTEKQLAWLSAIYARVRRQTT